MFRLLPNAPLCWIYLHRFPTPSQRQLPVLHPPQPAAVTTHTSLPLRPGGSSCNSIAMYIVLYIVLFTVLYIILFTVLYVVLYIDIFSFKVPKNHFNFQNIVF